VRCERAQCGAQSQRNEQFLLYYVLYYVGCGSSPGLLNGLVRDGGTVAARRRTAWHAASQGATGIWIPTPGGPRCATRDWSVTKTELFSGWW